MFNNARTAYEAVGKAGSSSSQLEAEALFKAARVLESCQNSWSDPMRPERLREGLRHNQRLWTLFQVELENMDHPMDPTLRASLLRLARFVDQRTFDLIAVPDPEKLRLLIDINRQVAAGLANQPADHPGSSA
jgi:flagellar protein FlaF